MSFPLCHRSLPLIVFVLLLTAASCSARRDSAAGAQGTGSTAAPSSPTASSTAGSAPEVVKMGGPRQIYIDHEILQEEGLMVYQSRDEIWIGELDPRTGLFRSGSGRDRLVDRNVTPMTVARNGPEFGVDSSGWSVFYNKDVDGLTQIWQATPAGGGFRTRALTAGGYDRINQLPSRDPTAPTVFLLYGRGDASGFRQGARGLRQDRRQGLSSRGGANIVWMGANQPGDERIVTAISPKTAGFRWIDGTSQFVSTKAEGDHYGQIVLTDARTGQSKIITNDDDIKFDPYGWLAPDFGNDLLVLAAVGHSDVVVYRDTGKPYWERIARLGIPEKSRLGYIQSSEPFTAAGRSYIVSTIKDSEGPVMRTVKESEIWVYDLNPDPARRFVLRCDDGLPGKIRHEGEVFLGSDQVFIYYNEINKGKSIDLYLCRSGIPSR